MRHTITVLREHQFVVEGFHRKPCEQYQMNSKIGIFKLFSLGRQSGEHPGGGTEGSGGTNHDFATSVGWGVEAGDYRYYLLRATHFVYRLLVPSFLRYQDFSWGMTVGGVAKQVQTLHLNTVALLCIGENLLVERERRGESEGCGCFGRSGEGPTANDWSKVHITQESRAIRE